MGSSSPKTGGRSSHLRQVFAEVRAGGGEQFDRAVLRSAHLPTFRRGHTPRRDVVLEVLVRSLEELARYRLNCRVDADTALGSIGEAHVA